MKKFKKIPMPNGTAKDKIVDVLLREEYGYIPNVYHDVSVRVLETDEDFYGGKAIYRRLLLVCQINNAYFGFPVNYIQCASVTPTPCIIHINFSDNVPDRYQPTEEIIDSGHSILSFNYQDVTKDNYDFSDGLAEHFFAKGSREQTDCGKLALWAWAIMRVMDYAVTVPAIDKNRISVAGHLRLGKAALLAGALDERFYCVFANDSGCGGAAISRDKKGETLAEIYGRFEYWFSKEFEKYCHNENSLPFDQHFLLAANAPHRVYIGSARDDMYSDPENEYKSCVLASSYFQECGCPAFIDEPMLRMGKKIKDGYIGYHIRTGGAYLSRVDWNNFIGYLKKSYKEDKKSKKAK